MSWRIQVVYDGLLPMETQHRLATELRLSVLTLGEARRTEVSRWIDEPLLTALDRMLRELTGAGITLPKVQIVCETETEYAERVSKLYAPAGPADPAVTQEKIQR